MIAIDLELEKLLPPVNPAPRLHGHEAATRSRH